MNPMVYRFAWANNEKRKTLVGRDCVIVTSGTKQSALVEFLDGGQREVVSRRALRKMGQR